MWKVIQCSFYFDSFISVAFEYIGKYMYVLIFYCFVENAKYSYNFLTKIQFVEGICLMRHGMMSGLLFLTNQKARNIPTHFIPTWRAQSWQNFDKVSV